MNFQKLTQKLIKDLDEIKFQNENIIQWTYHSIKVCRKLLYFFKKEIISNDFTTIDEEITFFKEIKQVPLTNLIYFSEIHSFELQFPKAGKNYQLKFIKNKINKLNRFFSFNIDFGQYVNSGATHLDTQYYTRGSLDKFHVCTSKFFLQDPEFCTPRDMLLGKYTAYNSFIFYLVEKSNKINNVPTTNLYKPTEKIKWPFSNTDYVELIYALHSKGLGEQDNQSIIQISRKLQQTFDFTPKDIYKTFQNIKNRKVSRTHFLDQLSTSLLAEINKSEE